jgi:quinolinate synthase
MADMVTVEALQAKKREHPTALVVSYVNSSAEVKAESDLCCTSSNAVKVINSIPTDREIIFVPDRNLGQYAANQTGRNLILWDGCCPIHDVLDADELRQQMDKHPEAKVVVHPECRPEIAAMADAVCSTAGILNYIKNSDAQAFIVGTEEGFLHTVEATCPERVCYPARNPFVCQDMKLIDLQMLADSLVNLQEQIIIPEDIRERAFQALDHMLQLG